jgi:DnaJ-class molecular chaperone
MINYYEVLGVDIKAEAIVIRSAYKAMIQKYHPDKAIDKKQIDEYLEKTKLINEAYNVLSNEVMRKKYNEKMSDSSYSDEEINYDSEEDDITSSINERWLKIIEYVQGLDDLYKELDKISKDLSWEFKASVVST